MDGEQLLLAVKRPRIYQVVLALAWQCLRLEASRATNTPQPPAMAPFNILKDMVVLVRPNHMGFWALLLSLVLLHLTSAMPISIAVHPMRRPHILLPTIRIFQRKATCLPHTQVAHTTIILMRSNHTEGTAIHMEASQ